MLPVGRAEVSSTINLGETSQLELSSNPNLSQSTKATYSKWSAARRRSSKAPRRILIAAFAKTMASKYCEKVSTNITRAHRNHPVEFANLFVQTRNRPRKKLRFRTGAPFQAGQLFRLRGALHSERGEPTADQDAARDERGSDTQWGAAQERARTDHARRSWER